MHTKPELIEVRALRNEWSREAHYARVLPALGLVIDVTPRCVAQQPPRPEERRNQRVAPVRLIAHQTARELAMERRALEAANEALAPLHRSLAMRLWRAVRSLVGGRG
jgi:hypothetical protein